MNRWHSHWDASNAVSVSRLCSFSSYSSGWVMELHGSVTQFRDQRSKMLLFTERLGLPRKPAPWRLRLRTGTWVLSPEIRKLWGDWPVGTRWRGSWLIGLQRATAQLLGGSSSVEPGQPLLEFCPPPPFSQALSPKWKNRDDFIPSKAALKVHETQGWIPPSPTSDLCPHWSAGAAGLGGSWPFCPGMLLISTPFFWPSGQSKEQWLAHLRVPPNTEPQQKAIHVPETKTYRREGWCTFRGPMDFWFQNIIPDCPQALPPFHLILPPFYLIFLLPFFLFPPLLLSFLLWHLRRNLHKQLFYLYVC